MGLYDEVELKSDLFGVHKGERHQTKSLDPNGGSFELYEITEAGRLEYLEYNIEDHSNPNAKGVERCFGMLSPVYTGKRRDLNYHGWLELSCFGRAKFTDGTLVAFEPEVGDRTVIAPEEMEVSIYAEGDVCGTLQFREGKASAICDYCECTVTDVRGPRYVIEGIWRHLIFEHTEIIDVLDVEGLDRISKTGIRLPVRIVVRSK